MNERASSSDSGSEDLARALHSLAREGGLRMLQLGTEDGVGAAVLLAGEGREVCLVDRHDEALETARERGISRTVASAPDRDEWAEQLTGDTFDVIMSSAGDHVGRLLDVVRNRGLLAPDGFVLLAAQTAAPIDAERRGFSITRRAAAGRGRFVVRLDPMGGVHELARLRVALDRLRAQFAETEDRLQAALAAAKAEAERYRAEAQEVRRKLRRIYESPLWRARGVVARVTRPVRGRREAVPPRPVQPLPPRPVEKPPEVPVKPSRPEPAGLAVEYEVRDDETMRAFYESALAKKAFETNATHVVFLLPHPDLDHLRRHALVAVGLGRWLDRGGFEVIHLPPDRWNEVPAETQIIVAMSPDADPLSMPEGCVRVAWIRDRVEVWARSAGLILSHGVLAASESIASEIERFYPGPVTVMKDGVDAEFFAAGDDLRLGAIATIPQRGRELHLYAAMRAGIDYPLAIFGEQRGLHASLERFHRGAASPFAMPRLYRQAALVLAESTEEGVGPPILSGRIFEALASGALVVTDSTTGLSEAHLEEIPAYISPNELRAIIHRFLDDPGQRDELAARLRDVVFREHTYERRASEFAAFLRSIETKPGGVRPRFVAFYPHYQRNNPYQRMLYADGREFHAIPLADPSRLTRSPLLETNDFAFHLHWTNPILEDARDEETARISMEAFLATLDEMRARGVKIVWTIHNILPHESVFPDLEAALCQGIADRANVIHVMCEETPLLVAPFYRLPQERVRVIPHGSYIDVYPNIVTPQRAREELGLEPSHTVFCCFGGIRRYKGIDHLLDAFEAVHEAKPETRLLVVGPRGTFEGADVLAERCATHPAIVSNFNRVADEDVQLYLNASDVVVLPQHAPLNSGALMLALSFGRPVVAPRAGCVAGMVSSDVGMHFDPDKPGDLKRVLVEADRMKTRSFREAAYRKAEEYPQHAMAEEFARIMKELFES